MATQTFEASDHKLLVAGNGGSAADAQHLVAEFVVRLPISPLVSTTLGVPKVRAMMQAPPSSSTAEQLAGVRVLVVDDDPDARELLSLVLEMSGVEVRAAASAAEALALLDRTAQSQGKNTLQ